MSDDNRVHTQYGSFENQGQADAYIKDRQSNIAQTARMAGTMMPLFIPFIILAVIVMAVFVVTRYLWYFIFLGSAFFISKYLFKYLIRNKILRILSTINIFIISFLIPLSIYNASIDTMDIKAERVIKEANIYDSLDLGTGEITFMLSNFNKMKNFKILLDDVTLEDIEPVKILGTLKVGEQPDFIGINRKRTAYLISSNGITGWVNTETFPEDTIPAIPSAWGAVTKMNKKTNMEAQTRQRAEETERRLKELTIGTKVVLRREITPFDTDFNLLRTSIKEGETLTITGSPRDYTNPNKVKYRLIPISHNGTNYWADADRLVRSIVRD